MLKRIVHGVARRLLSWSGSCTAGIPSPSLPEHGWVDVQRDGFSWRLCMDHWLDKAYAEGQRWEADSVDLVRTLVKPGMHVVDVGANFGLWALELSRLVGPAGHVLAFEPTAQYGKRLTDHLSRNGIRNATVVPLGLSDKTIETEICIGNSSATMHWAVEKAPTLRETIRLVALDDWWAAYVKEGHPDRLDFLKVDTDGHEPFFLEGARQTLQRLKPPMLIEFVQENLVVNGHTAWGLADQLEQMGYVLCSEKDGKPFPTRLDLLRVAGNFCNSANVLALPKP